MSRKSGPEGHGTIKDGKDRLRTLQAERSMQVRTMTGYNQTQGPGGPENSFFASLINDPDAHNAGPLPAASLKERRSRDGKEGASDKAPFGDKVRRREKKEDKDSSPKESGRGAKAALEAFRNRMEKDGTTATSSDRVRTPRERNK